MNKAEQILFIKEYIRSQGSMAGQWVDRILDVIVTDDDEEFFFITEDVSTTTKALANTQAYIDAFIDYVNSLTDEDKSKISIKVMDINTSKIYTMTEVAIGVENVITCNVYDAELGEKLTLTLSKISGSSNLVYSSAVDKRVDDVVEGLGALERKVDKIMESEWYGIEWSNLVANPVVSRIGKTEFHKTLPIQSKMRRCLVSDDGTINYYLHAENSSLKEDGTEATLDGADGQVMVEVPSFYLKFEYDGNIVRWKISELPLQGYTKTPKCYYSAYQATIDRTATPKLASVVNLTPEFRGGANTAAEIAHDADGGTLLGKPTTNVSLTNFRTYARNRDAKWNCDVYSVRKLVAVLYFVEYANKKCKAAYNDTLTSEGFRQGGLGNGVTDLITANITGMTGGSYACVPCGITNSLGNYTGIVAYDMPSEYGAEKTTYVPSYRGIENPFGHLWSRVDGVKCLIQSEEAGGESELYVCDDPAKYSSSGIDGYQLKGLLPRETGFVKELIPEEIMPLITTGGSSTTYWCDYVFTSIPASGVSERSVAFGANAIAGSIGGFVCSGTHSAASSAEATMGSRLCYFPD